MSEANASAGKRRPVAEDLEPVLRLISEGFSLNKTCQIFGLDTPSTYRWLHEDEGRRQNYARALEMRADCQQEEALDVARAAATGVALKVGDREVKVDPAGARVLLDAIKWSSARMAPKTAPVQRVDVTSRTRQMTDEEIAAEIAALEGGAQAAD